MPDQLRAMVFGRATAVETRRSWQLVADVS